jgi:signal peptidase II
MRKERLTIALVVVAIIALDQVTKVLAARMLALHESIPVIESFFHLTHARNTGAAFSLLAETPAWFRQPFFLIVTVAAIVALGLFLRQIEDPSRFVVIAVAAILGGAVGNLIDRVLYGEVVDFLLFHWRGYYWPAFNVADTCITLGVIGLLWSSLQEHRREKQNGFVAS